MRRGVWTFLAVAVVLTFSACADRPSSDPLGPTDETLLGKKGPDGCLAQGQGGQQELFDEINGEIGGLFGNKGSRNAATQQLNNIGRKLCEGDFADALDKAFGYLGLIDEKYPGLFTGDASAAAGHASKIFELVAAAPNPADPFEIPPGAFDPETGGVIVFDPDEVTLPFVATTGNNEAAVVLDLPNVFPPGTGPVTIVLSRSAGNLVTSFGAYIPGFQAFEEGYEIISSHQPWELGPGILVAICVVPIDEGVPPADAAIGQLHNGTDVSLLVPTDPDPQDLGYIDCSDVDPTTFPVEASWTTDAGPDVGAGVDAGGSSALSRLAQRVLEPMGRLLAPASLNAEAVSLAVGPGLGGRTKSFSLNAPVDPVIEVDGTVVLQAGFDATWTSDDEGIATVEGLGDSAEVTGVCPGTTFITAAFGEEESLSIRITVEGEGGEECEGEFADPVLEQTGASEGDGVVYQLELTNADDYAALFDAEEFPFCDEGTDAPLLLEIWDTGNEVPEDEFCVDSLSDLELFTLTDPQASAGSLGAFEDVFVVLHNLATEESATSNTITLVPPPESECPC